MESDYRSIEPCLNAERTSLVNWKTGLRPFFGRTTHAWYLRDPCIGDDGSDRKDSGLDENLLDPVTDPWAA
jgi:hypothetical protein